MLVLNLKYPKEIIENREVIEGNFVMCLWKNPSEFYEDYKIKATDLMTEDGMFYYNLGKALLNKNIVNFDDISISTFLKDYPSLEEQYNKRGGYKEIKDFIKVLDASNIEAYYGELIKNNLYIKLFLNGFDVVSKIQKFKDLSADDVYNYYDAVLNGVSLENTHDLNLETLEYTEEDIRKNIEGEDIGLQYNKFSPLLNSWSGGIPRNGLTMFGSYTNVGKTSFIFQNIVIPIVEQKIKVAYISNEQNAIKFKPLLYVYVLTEKLNYWKINRKKLQNMNSFTEEDREMFKKADKIVKEQYMPYIYFQRIYNYDINNIKKTIRKLSRQKVELFVYDTFKMRRN